MANTIAIKNRIGSVKNTRQITKAMELVAASRMRRSQDAAAASRMYSTLASELLSRLSELGEVKQSQLFEKRKVKAKLLILVTSDRGLAGAYNSNAIKTYLSELKRTRQNNTKVYTLCVGQKGATFCSRLEDTEVIGAYRDLADNLSSEDVVPIVRTMIEMYTSKQIDAVDVIYTHFFSSIKQEAKLRHLLPAGFTEEPVSSELRLAEFEPSAEAVLEQVTLRLIEAQLLQTLLESAASEHSMRMMAMKNATDNANDLVDDLTLAFNNARQAAITQELAEITGGAEALK